MSSKIIDACSLINLYASGRVVDVLQALEGEFYVPRQVRKESLSIRKADLEDSTRLMPEPIDLGNLLHRGALRECAIEGEAEAETLLRFAADLDDGEAACLAIAKVRRWTVATDDRKALRIAATEGIAVITTPEVMHTWARQARPAKHEVQAALRNIELYARFRPGHSSPLFGWWRRQLE